MANENTQSKSSLQPRFRSRKTKIVSTLGPSSSDKAVIKKLVETGVDVFRLNFSHGSHDEHSQRIQMIREIEAETQRVITILGDLQGPKLRVGQVPGGKMPLKAGEVVQFYHADYPVPTALDQHPPIPLPHEEIFEAVQIGHRLLIDDGRLRLVVTDIDAKTMSMATKVEAGSAISDRKGVNLPESVITRPVLTEKDKKDLAFILTQDIDWVALSFVQHAEDLKYARRVMDELGGSRPLLAKLEKPMAVEEKELAKIITEADAIMVARGDLGVEIPPELVPIVQKRIVRASRAAGKPVVVATQMLDSMTNAPTPTRAEASDVATAVFDGADAVMLSGETAAGQYPVESVAMMNRIISSVEGDVLYHKIMDAEHPEPNTDDDHIVTSAACKIAHQSSAKAVVNFTATGRTALSMARERASVPVLCLTGDTSVARRLGLSYGVFASHQAGVETLDQMLETCAGYAREAASLNAGDKIVITAGVPFGQQGSTNMIKLMKV